MRSFFVSSLILSCGVAWSAQVAGTVVDSADKGVADATVWAWQDRDVQKAQTDSAGAFTFATLAPKPVTLIAYKDGLSIGSVQILVTGMGPAKIQLGDAASLSVTIKDTNGAAAPGASIANLLVNDSMPVPVADLIEQGFPWHRSDDAGKLVFPDLPKDGHVSLTLSHRDYPDLHIPYLPVGGKEQTLVMYPGVKLRGRVTGPDGAGLARARVTAVWAGAGKEEVSEALTDQEGFYRMPVKPKEFYLVVRHPDFASPEPIKVTPGNDEEVTADLAMATAHWITGKVVMPDGSPCSGVSVSYWIDKTAYDEEYSQADGTFRVQAPDREGRIRVVSPPGFMTEALSEIPVTGKLQPEIALAPVKLKAMPLIEGQIVGEDGAQRPGVLISSVDLTPPVWAITGPEGKFRLQLYQMPEAVTARFLAEDGEHFQRGAFEVNFDDMKPVEVRLSTFEPDVLPKEVPRGQNDLSQLVGQVAPELVCRQWFGKQTTLASLRGKVVVMLFWAGFDQRPATRDSLEELRALHDLFADADDVAFVSVHDGGEEPEKVQEYVKASGIEFPVGLDGEAFNTFQTYGIRYIPQVVLIDKHGLVRHFVVQGRLLELIKALRREG